MDNYSDDSSKAVPSSRLSRLGKLGALAGKVAANVLYDGSKHWLKGQKPVMRDLLVSEKNLSELADKLATMRGAAMKAGQLLSMDAGTVVPPQLAYLLDRLRADAVTMPATQLLEVLEQNWGDNWLEQFKRFSYEPIAAASIGQVHHGLTQDEQSLAIKIQYPGIAESIDSDLKNVIALFRLSGLIPEGLDLTPLVDEAAVQLKREADYLYEGQQMMKYAELLHNFEQRDALLLPAYHAELSTDKILCMSYMQGQPLEKLAFASQQQRDGVAQLLLRLFFSEFFKFHCVQTDPNFANYLYNLESQQLVLLDFGATRDFSPDFVEHYKCALQAAAENDRTGLLAALSALGFFRENSQPANRDSVLDIFLLATEPLRHNGAYDFSSTQLVEAIRQKSLSMRSDPDAWHSPPPDVLFLHRKIAGLYLIAHRLKACVDVRALIAPYW